MADQNLNVNLTVNSTQLVQGVSQAASGVEKVGNSADNASGSLSNMEQTAVSGAINITRAEKNIAVAINQIQQAAEKKGFFAKLGETSIKINAIAGTAKKISEPLKKVVVTLQEIGEKAQELGTSAEYFQKLEKASEQSGEKFEDVRSVFEKINETAKKALSGDADAAKKLENIGIAVDDLRGKSPDQIFEHVAGALAAAGDEAINSGAALAVCGDRLTEIGDNLGDIANAKAKIGDDEIIPDEAVQASLELKKNFSDFGKELLVLAAQSGVLSFIGVAARLVKGMSDDIKEFKRTWSEINQARGMEVEDTRPAWKKWGARAIDWTGPGLLFNMINDPHGKDRTLGERIFGLSDEGNVGGLRTGPATEEDKRRFMEERTRRLGIEQSAQAEQQMRNEQAQRTREAIAAAKSPDAQMPKEQEIDREAERARREAERQELQRRREEARAAMQRQRELERLRREEERARQRDIQTAERPARKRKRKSREVGESAQLSTAGSISDPKAARAQRRHELRLAREAAKQKITVKVRPVKGAVIRNAVSTAVGGSLKQLAAAVERLSLQTYIVK